MKKNETFYAYVDMDDKRLVPVGSLIRIVKIGRKNNLTDLYELTVKQVRNRPTQLDRQPRK